MTTTTTIDVVASAEKDDEGTACEICGLADRPAILLLCDRCDEGFHTTCVDPPLAEVPEGDWFCPDCLVSTKVAAEDKNDDDDDDIDSDIVERALALESLDDVFVPVSGIDIASDRRVAGKNIFSPGSPGPPGPPGSPGSPGSPFGGGGKPRTPLAILDDVVRTENAENGENAVDENKIRAFATALANDIKKNEIAKTERLLRDVRSKIDAFSSVVSTAARALETDLTSLIDLTGNY